MASFNKVILIGNLTRDPELRYTPKGTAVAKLGLAVNRGWTTDAGEKKEEVTFVDVDVFGRTAENCGQYLRKGRPLLVEGRLKLEQWDDKQTGQKKQRLGVVGELVQFLGSKPEDGGRKSEGGSQRSENDGADWRSGPPAPAARDPQQAAEDPQPGPPPESDDVPF